jgi:hypothetical protein
VELKHSIDEIGLFIKDYNLYGLVNPDAQLAHFIIDVYLTFNPQKLNAKEIFIEKFNYILAGLKEGTITPNSGECHWVKILCCGIDDESEHDSDNNDMLWSHMAKFLSSHNIPEIA